MKKTLAILVLALLPMASRAQCEVENTAFQGGEALMYELFFNWKFIWVKVGSATMTTRKSIYQGQQGFRTTLTTRGNKMADKLFVLRDTLVSVVTDKLVPLYYRKGAEEGKNRHTDETWYSYADGKANLLLRHVSTRGNEHTLQWPPMTECVYDMLSMFMRARSFDPSSFAKGQRIPFYMADGGVVKQQTLVYRGKENFHMESTGTTYRCMVFSFVEPDKKTGREKDVVTFYITDDDNHLPVRLDMHLSFGSAKAFLAAKTGVRHPMTSVVKNQQ